MAQFSTIGDDAALLDGLTAIASRAAAAILKVGADLVRRDKADGSPVTAADEAAEAEILQGLAQLLPGVPVVSEEAAGRSAPHVTADHFVLVDPLDGTRELIAGEAEYTVNIALVSSGKPVIGVVAAPALGLVWRGIVGRGAERLQLAPDAEPADARERKPIRTRARPAHGAVATVSRFHREADADAWLERYPGVQRVVCGSSLKFCRIAEGAADLYVRLGAMAEWDVAAGHAVLTAAGGAVTTMQGAALTYAGQGSRLPAFIAAGDRG